MPTEDVEQRVVLLTNPSNVPLTPIELSRPLCGAKMKGFPLLHLLDAMERARGPSLAEAWRATLPAEFREQTQRRAVTSVSWLPMEFYFHGVAWAARELFGPGERHAMRIGHQTAAADIGAFFGFVLSMASPATVLSLSGRFWKSYFDRSTLKVLESTASSCTAEVSDWPLRDAESLHEMAGSLVAWMEASRAKEVKFSRFELVGPGHFVLDAVWR